MKGEHIHIFEKDPIPGGACDGWKFENVFIRNIKLAVRVGILAPVHGGPTEGVVGVFLVQPVILIQLWR